MKKVISALCICFTMFSLVACGTKNNSESGSGSDSSKIELALITDTGTIDDKSFNQGCWEGLVQYAEENDITYKYYQPSEKSTDAYKNAMELAAEGGAKVIVCSGFLFETAVYDLQNEYPDTKIILVDGTPHNEDETDYTIADNVVSITFSEEQAGFLAGYSAVKDGYKKLGFLGGISIPAVIRYGYGFVQGAECAAQELNLTDVEVKYNYTGTFEATPEVQSMAASWYNEGTEVIFACGGAIGNSIMRAAEAAGKKVIGVDVDQSTESDTVITSAMKQLSTAVYGQVKANYEGNFAGGEALVLGVSDDAIGLPMDTSQFTAFTNEDYEAILKSLVDGKIDLQVNTDVDSVSELNIKNVTVKEIQ